MSTAMRNLDHVKWNGQYLRVTMSKHMNIQLAKEGLPVSYSLLSPVVTIRFVYFCALES